MTGKGFILLASMRAKEGKIDELLNLIKPIVEESKTEKGTLQYQFSQGREEPNEVRIWEEYDSEESFAKHKEGKSFIAFADKKDGLLDGELKLEKYEIVSKI